MLAKKSLKDLYVQGKEFDFGVGDDKITVYFKKLNSFETELAFKKANAVRAAVLSKKFLDDEHIDKLEYFAEIDELGSEKDDLIDLVLADKVSDIYLKVEQRISEDEKWKEDGRLQGLFELWRDGLSEEYALDKSDASVKVFEQLQEFASEVESGVQAELNVLKRDEGRKSIDRLRKELVDKLIEMEANRVWVVEYNKWEVYLSARDPENHSVKLLGSRDEIDEMSDEGFNELLTAYRSITVDDVSLKS